MDNKNISEHIYNDKFFQEKLNDKSLIEKAPIDFTNKTMDKIMQEWISNPLNDKKNKHSTRYWLILLSSVSMGVLVYLATDLRKLISMSDINWLKSFDSTYLTQINNLYSYLLNSFSNITPMVFIILFAVLAVIIADRLIKRFPRYSNVYIL